LFANLGYGRNAETIKIIQEKYCSLEFILTGLKSDNLDHYELENPKKTVTGRVRIALTDLLLALYIDVGNNRPILRRVQMSHLWEDLDDIDAEKALNDKAMSLSGEVLPFFPNLSDWVAKFLSSHTAVIFNTNHKNHNEFVVAVLRVVHTLVLFGYYNIKEDVIKLLAPLYQILGSDGDSPTTRPMDEKELANWKKATRLQEKTANATACEVKLAGLRILDLMNNLRTLLVLKQFLYDYKGLAAASKIGEGGLFSHDFSRR